MPSISQRGQYTPASPIRKLVPFATRAKNRGVKVYHLNIGQPDIVTPDIGWNAVKEANIEVLEYSHSAGMESYRLKLVEFYTRYGIQLTHNDIIVTNGGSEALMFAMMACLDAGDEIIVPEPFYANYNGFAQSLGINIRPITSSIEDGFALPPIESFEALITPHTKAILICNPANPTGYLYSPAELEALGEMVKKYDLYLFSDEVYRDFCYDGRKHLSVLAIPGLEEHTIMIDSISKRYSACGARIGLMVTRNKAVLETAMKFAQARLSPSTLGQIMGEAFIDADMDYLDQVRIEYDKRRQLVLARLRAMEGVIAPTPNGAFYLLAQLPVDDTDNFCQWLLESFQLDGETVMLAPGSGFYATLGLGLQEVRIAYVLNEADLNKALDCLEEALKLYPGRTINNNQLANHR
ncbi:pyridoxal phosphate-dependent aminotransferase [Saprospira sp. CCB-QB6]|uniref:pyridoxal phosphate-dependent aminotransferase n=1 Tax=Saprospira sp. CCB-QB6 TaxID=3023936 RepID=UPI002349D860|nr:pyridoxal phosphate-dependent aminotransferase [Saprospira sp. CCB-QB6]WCL81869.1 pyridoxal phosphate-dependent aminotransferase [Saprospira sp. CCB-QB6]